MSRWGHAKRSFIADPNKLARTRPDDQRDDKAEEANRWAADSEKNVEDESRVDTPHELISQGAGTLFRQVTPITNFSSRSTTKFALDDNVAHGLTRQPISLDDSLFELSQSSSSLPADLTAAEENEMSHEGVSLSLGMDFRPGTRQGKKPARIASVRSFVC